MKNELLADFYFFFLFFSLKNFFTFEIFEKIITVSKGSSPYLFKCIKRFELAHEMAGRGGA